MNFQLFKIKVHKRKQLDLYAEAPPLPSIILREAILSRPIRQMGNGDERRIGNILIIDDNSMFFRLGRARKRVKEVISHDDFNLKYLKILCQPQYSLIQN